MIDDEGKDDSTGSGKEKDDQSPSLDKRVTQPGRHVGDRYVRIVRPTGSGLRGHGGRWVATEETMERTGRIGRAWASALRFLIGQRLETEAEGEEREILRYACLYEIYHRYLGAFDELIAEPIKFLSRHCFGKRCHNY